MRLCHRENIAGRGFERVVFGGHTVYLNDHVYVDAPQMTMRMDAICLEVSLAVSNAIEETLWWI